MNKIPIFKAEACIDGLAEQIRAESSVSYAAAISPFKPSDTVLGMVKAGLHDWFKAHASEKDSDLYYTRSILVTSNWNLNDDVFDKYETWAARHTPSHKPTNIGHDEHQIVGHMTDNWVIDAEGNIVPDTSLAEDVPDIFHIVTSSVIYTTWADPLLIERTQKLINQIEANKKFVSMECLFSNFGYALISPKGEFSTMARDENTAFLTKHLRRYGGKGEYNGYRVGRLLKNITFSAKGFVDEPANPESIILNSNNLFSFSKASQKNPFNSNSGVSISLEEDIQTNPKIEDTIDMSDTIYKDMADKLELQVATLQAKLEELTVENTKAGVEALKSEVTSLTAKVAELNEKLEQSTAKVTELSTAKASLEEEKAAVLVERDTLQAEVTKAQKAISDATRLAELVEAGAEKEDAEAQVVAFADLTEAQWNAVAATLKKAYTASKAAPVVPAEVVVEPTDDVDGADASADADVLDDATPTDQVDLSAGASNVDDATASVRKELQRAIATRLGKQLPDETEE